MKKIVSILSTIFLLSATLSSCTDLEENPYSSIPSDEFFNNEEEFLMSAGRIYAYLVRYTCYRCIWGTISVSTDEAVSPLREGNQWVDDGVWRDMHAHTWNSQMQDLQTIWEFLFGGISLCNQILYEFDQSSVDFEAKPSLVAEVLVMRAWFYLNAMDLFGNVPFTTDFSDTSLPRQVDRKFLFSFIEQQIKDNVGLLQDVPTASNYGRVTKAMAYTTLAKLYINAQEWIGEAKWDETIAACDQVIGFGQLEIEPDYFSNFKVDNTSSKENIFVILYDKVYTSQNWWHVFRFHQLTLNSLSQQTYGILDFCWNGFAATESFYNKYDPKDIRRRQWLAGPQYDMSGNPLLMQNGQQLDYTPHITSLFDFSNPAKSNEGVRSAKYEYANGLQGECMDNDYVVYRYADVLMMKGEALVRQGHADLAVPLFNEVRHRTGLDDYKASDLTLDEIYDERGREFAWEGLRRQDMIRFGKWGEARDLKPAVSPAYTKLYPIPANIRKTNTNLKQNDGYTVKHHPALPGATNRQGGTNSYTVKTHVRIKNSRNRQLEHRYGHLHRAFTPSRRNGHRGHLFHEPGRQRRQPGRHRGASGRKGLLHLQNRQRHLRAPGQPAVQRRGDRHLVCIFRHEKPVGRGPDYRGYRR